VEKLQGGLSGDHECGHASGRLERSRTVCRVGGGASIGVPLENVTLTNSNDIRTLVDFGVGVKWGGNGVGYGVEWRHHYYTWTPDQVVNGVRVKAHAGDASVVRASLFIYH